MFSMRSKMFALTLFLIAMVGFYGAKSINHYWTFSSGTVEVHGTVKSVRMEQCGLLLDSCGKSTFYRAFSTIEYRDLEGNYHSHVLKTHHRHRRADFKSGERVPVVYSMKTPGNAYVGTVNGVDYNSNSVGNFLGMLLVMMIAGGGAWIGYTYFNQSET